MGALLILMGSQNQEYFITGIVVMFGAYACISASKRKTNPSTLRLVVELILVAVIVISVLFANKAVLIEDPVPTLIIPLWAIIAYVVKISKK